jgi:ABC-2 type transport system permease protein
LIEMLRGLWKLTWLEIKIFAREPMGVVGSIAIPVVMFVVAGRIFGNQPRPASPRFRDFLNLEVPVLVAMVIALSAVLSLVTIISIYREGGILKRLRATPLRPHTILAAHVIVKLFFTTLTLVAMVLAGRQYYPASSGISVPGFAAALLLSTFSMLSIGFIIASVVPTARFAQPIGTMIMYPMIGISGLFAPIDVLPRTLQVAAHLLPTTYAVSLLKGVWRGDPWSAHLLDMAALLVVFLVCTAISSRVFRWE